MMRALPGGQLARRLLRQRLIFQLDDVWRRGIATLVAPAGSGKTTLLDQWAARCGAPVAWVTAESSDARATKFARRLGDAVSASLGANASCETVQDLIETLHRVSESLVILVDDAHNIRGAEAESLLATLGEQLPERVVLVVSSRQTPQLRLSRRRVSESLVEMGIEDLRFRSWETERLFQHEFGIAVLPEESTTLTTRTQGWAAGLQLFHLAVRDKSRAERKRLIDSFGGNYRAVGDYLADNVMAGLPTNLAEFMIASSPLAVLSSHLCDAYLSRSDSIDLLEELEHRGLFLLRRSDGQSYRYHEILRSYLDGVLTARVGEKEARALHYQAARLLLGSRAAAAADDTPADSGIDAAALRALCRAESWREAAELISERGEQLAETAAEIAGGIPKALFDSDPWLQLASARRHLASGNLGEAVSAFERCEAALPQSMAVVARRERLKVANWLTPIPSPAPGPSFALRRAVAAEPLSECGGHPDDSSGLSAQAMGCFLAGHVQKACELFEAASLHVNEASLDLAIRVGRTAATMFAARDANERGIEARRCLSLAAEADRLGIPWLNRQAHSLLALVGETDIAGEARRRCQSDNDQWGQICAGLLEGVGRLLAGEAPLDLLTETATLARAMGAGVLESVAMAALSFALTEVEYPDASATALAAEAMSRRAGATGAQALSHLALSRCSQQAAEHARYAAALAEECGLGVVHQLADRLATDPARPERVISAQAEDVQLRCFGGFGVWRNGARMDNENVRPRARSLLAILALHHPNPVHAEVLVESLWPDTEYETALHRMQTAISSLRRALMPEGSDGAIGARNPLVRRGSAYLLEGCTSDVDEFEAAGRAAETARVQGNSSAEAEALRRMLAAYNGDLLSEFGPAEWLVRDRERLRLMAADAAERLAEIELAAGRTSNAMTIANRGLNIDCYRESLWRLAEWTAEHSSDRAAAARVRSRRDAVLSELDICVD